LTTVVVDRPAETESERGSGPTVHNVEQMVALPQRRRFGRIEFNRPPRLRAVPRERRVELPAPPAAPAGPSGSTMGMLVIPLVATVVTSSVFVLFALTASGGQQTLMLIAAVALVAGAALPMAWLFFEDRRRIKRERRRQTERLPPAPAQP
jgi:hypothetical protein